MPHLGYHAESTGGPVVDADAARAGALAEAFVDLVFVPIQMRALLGEPARGLRSAAPGRIRGALRTLEAVGLLEGW